MVRNKMEQPQTNTNALYTMLLACLVEGPEQASKQIGGALDTMSFDTQQNALIQ